MFGRRTFRAWFHLTFLMCVLWLGAALCGQEKPQPDAAAENRIGVGDVLQIDVWGHSEITRTIQVQAGGKIVLPLVGDVKVAGLSAMEVARTLRDKLKESIPGAQVTVTVSPLGTKFLRAPGPIDVPKVQPPISPELKQKCYAA